MDQRNETFVPHVLAITTGTTVDFPNSDRIYHNVFSLSKTERVRPRPLRRRATRKSVRFDRPGIVRVFCDIHSHMNAFILVFSHPFFARDRRRRPLPDRQRAARHLQRRRLERRASRPSRKPVDRARRRRRPSSTSRCDDAALLAAQPDLPRQRAAGGAVDRRRDLPRQRAGHARGRERRCSARSSSTGALVDQLRTTRTQTFTMMARLIADAPKLKAAVDTNDPPTVQDIADGYQDQLKSNLLLVTNKTGEVLATVGASPRAATVVASQPAVRERARRAREPQPAAAARRHPAARDRADRDRPRRSPDILGTLSVGFLLDDALARAAEGDHRQRHRVRHGRPDPGDARCRATIAPALAELLRDGGIVANVTLGDEEYVALPLPLAPATARPDGGGPVALILRSRTEQLRFLQRDSHRARGHRGRRGAARRRSSASPSRARSRGRWRPSPTSMREVAATGDLTRKIALRADARWDDEDARLLATTFNTLTDSIARVPARDVADASGCRRSAGCRRSSRTRSATR